LREQEQSEQWSPRPVQRGGEPPPSADEQPGQSNGDLSNPEQVRRSIERDLALTVKAKREQEENVVEEGRVNNARRRFELTRDQVVFGFKLVVTMLFMIALVVSALTHPEPIKLLFTGVGTVAGVVSLLFRPAPTPSNE